MAGRKLPLLFYSFLFLFSSLSVWGQKKGETITEKEDEAIKSATRKTLSDFMMLLNNITTADMTSDDKAILIKGAFEGNGKIFSYTNAAIEDDYDPRATASGTPPSDAGKYLNSLMTFYKYEDTYDTVQYEVKDVSCVKKGSGGKKYIKVFYSQKFPGKYQGNDTSLHYTRVLRVADMTIIRDPEKKVWKTYISNIDFLDTSKVDDRQNCITVIHGMDISDTIIITEKNDAYYNYLVEKSKKNIKENKYVDAYVSVREAKVSDKYSKICAEIIRELFKKIEKTNIESGNPDIHNAEDYLNRKLVQKGDQLRNEFRYDAALKCYRYALELNPETKGLNNTINDMYDKIDGMEQLRSLYNKGIYDQAISAYKKELAISGNARNPYLYEGLASSYAKIPSEQDKAAANFEKALSIDHTNPDIYLAQGRFYEHKQDPNYNLAYKAFVNAVNNIEDKENPELNVIYSEIAFCKGLANFYQDNTVQALDSFNSALKLNPDNPEVLCYIGRCHYQLKEPKKAEKYLKQAIKINARMGEGYYWLGKVYCIANLYLKGDYSETAIDNFQKAIALEPHNAEWNLELGKRLMMRGYDQDNYIAAIGYFSTCIENDSLFAQEAFRDRAKCYYYLGKYDEAYKDYKNIYNQNLLDSSYYSYLGFIYLKTGNLTEARKCFSNVLASADGMLGMGEAVYLQDVGAKDKEPYLQWFRKAFSFGISHDFVNNDATVRQLTKDKDFRKLRKTYGY